jgi:hypothetical protein
VLLAEIAIGDGNNAVCHPEVDSLENGTLWYY